MSNINISVDSGNKMMKTPNFVFPAGLKNHYGKEPVNVVDIEYIRYGKNYYTISEQHIPNVKDKSSDESYNILMMVAIAKELQLFGLDKLKDLDGVIRTTISLAVGLPISHYKSLGPVYAIFDLNLREVWKYRDLILLFTKRSFVITYKQTILGPAWIFLNPLISSLVYAFVFGGIAGISTDGIPQMLFYLCSNAIWIFFSSGLTKNANVFTANSNVFGKVYFPRLTMPIANVLESVIQFGVQMILVILFLAYYLIIGAVSPNWWAWLLIPVVLLHLGLLSLGCGIIISSLTTKYRDLSIVVTFGIQLWMYATPIVYPMSQLSGGFMETVLKINPVTAPVEIFRYAVLGQGTISWFSYGLSWVITVLVVFVGIMIFNHVEKTFMDTV